MFSTAIGKQSMVVVKSLYRSNWPMGPALNPGFLSMKRLGVLLLPPGWDASLLQGNPQHICWYPFVHLGEEKHCESKVSCLRTQHNDPGRRQGSNRDWSIRSKVNISWKKRFKRHEGEKIPQKSSLTFYLTLLRYSDQDFTWICNFQSFIHNLGSISAALSCRLLAPPLMG